MMGLAASALACAKPEVGGVRVVAAVSADQAKNDPGRALDKADHLSSLALADLQAKLQAKEDALTQLRADVAAATSVDEVKAALKAADFGLFGRCGWHHHGGRFGDRNDNSRFGDRNRNGGFGGDNNQRSSYRGGDRRGGPDSRGGNDSSGGGFHH